MEDLTKGEIPKELRKKYPQGVNVALNDKRKDKYKKPKEKPSFFKGEGINLGNPQGQPVKIELNSNTNQNIPLNNAEKAHDLQLRFSDG